jgi:hypothetical protein
VQVTVEIAPRRPYTRDLLAGLRSNRRARAGFRLGLGVAALATIVGAIIGAEGGSRPVRSSAAASVPTAGTPTEPRPLSAGPDVPTESAAPGAPALNEAELRSPGPAGVAAAFHYPLACLSVTMLSTHPAYATAQLDRASPCWRYGVYVTAIFRRTGGEWRLMLEADSDSCPKLSLPPTVRRQLAACAGPQGRARRGY